MKKRTVLILSLIFIALLCGVVWQYKAIQDSKTEIAKLRVAMQQLETLRIENQRLSQINLDTEELERLKKQQSELLQLHGETGRLRRQLAEMAAKEKQLPKEIAELPTETESPVTIYKSKVRATVGADQSLVIGGWETKPGRRTLVFLLPQINSNDSPPSISIPIKIVELPENFPATFGLAVEGFGGGTGVKETPSGFMFDRNQALRLFNKFKEMEGVVISSTPEVSVANGREAEVRVAEQKTIGKVHYQLGPTVNLVPTISADGSSIDLSVRTQLILENQPKK